LRAFIQRNVAPKVEDTINLHSDFNRTQIPGCVTILHDADLRQTKNS